MTGLATPSILVNDEAIGIKPNSFTFTEGFGERNVRVKSTGGGNSAIVVTPNAETQVSKVKFTLITEAATIEKVREWLSRESNNVIEALDGNFTRTFTQAVISNDPENGLGESGEISLEWTTQKAK